MTKKVKQQRDVMKDDLFLKGFKSFVDKSHNKVAHVSLFKHKRPSHDAIKVFYGKQPWLKDRQW